jgi:hypothetical protein
MSYILIHGNARSAPRLAFHVENFFLYHDSTGPVREIITVQNFFEAKVLLEQRRPALVITGLITNKSNPSQCGPALYGLTSRDQIPLVIVSSLSKVSGYSTELLALPDDSPLFGEMDDWVAGYGISDLPRDQLGKTWFLVNGLGNAWRDMEPIRYLLC